MHFPTGQRPKENLNGNRPTSEVKLLSIRPESKQSIYSACIKTTTLSNTKPWRTGPRNATLCDSPLTQWKAFLKLEADSKVTNVDH